MRTLCAALLAVLAAAAPVSAQQDEGRDPFTPPPELQEKAQPPPEAPAPTPAAEGEPALPDIHLVGLLRGSDDRRLALLRLGPDNVVLVQPQARFHVRRGGTPVALVVTAIEAGSVALRLPEHDLTMVIR